MIHPWGQYVAVEDPPAEAQDGTYGGIHLPPGTGLDMIAKGVVIGVGPDLKAPDGFEPGAVCWYMHAHAIELGLDAKMKFVNAGHLLAWEAA